MESKVDTRWFQNALADKRLSQRKLATTLGLDPAAVSLMLRGKRKMSAAEAAEIANLLGVGVDEVLLRSGSTLVVPSARRSVHAPAPSKAVVAPSPLSGELDDALELPVPLLNGGTATLVLPRLLSKADAERIAALVTAFASKG